MKKNGVMSTFLRWKVFQFLIMMKVVWVIILASALQAAATESYSQATKISLSMKDASLEEVIWTMKKLTQFRFFYKNEEIEKIQGLNVEFSDQTVDAILDECLKNTGLTYEIVHKAVILHKYAKKIEPPGLSPDSEVDAPQEKTITGKVTDTQGLPLPGVTVIVKGTTVGTVTNNDGEFTLDVPITAEVIQFSFVGMKAQEMSLEGKISFNIVLEEETADLEEVVVVGYGTQKKIAVTGAVSAIQTKDLTQSSAATIDNALAGKITGLTSIQSGGGQPGMDDATIYLRGAATSNTKSPLILIDGVPRDNMRTLDANEVESVSILKDASATALFGIRGANGVILITTKRGVEGESKLSINVEQSYSSFTKEPERLHSWDYMRLRNEAYENDGEDALYSEEEIAKYIDPLDGLNPDAENYEEQARIRKYIYPDHDYYREFISKYSPTTRINANLRGGTNRVKYFMNAGYLHQGGNLNTEPESQLGYDPSSKMDRYTFRANLDFNISESLSAYLNLGTYIEKVNMPYVGSMYNQSYTWMMGDLIYQAQTILPITPGPTTISGYGIEEGQIVDPSYLDRSAFEIMNRRGYRRDVRSNLNSSLGFNWDLGKLITPGLSIKGMISYDSYGGTTLQGGKTERLYTANVDYENDELSYSVYRSSESSLSVSKSAETYYDINMQGTINYSRSFDKHNVGGMIVAQRDFWDHGAEIPHNVIGFSSRFTYAYDDRYFGEIDMCYNGSEQFAPANRFGFFPAFSSGWVVSNEEFLKDNPVLDYLKIRASVGKVGNDQMSSNRFLYLDDTTISSGGLSSLGNGGYIVDEGIRGNKKLKWETAWKWNVGIDYQIFDNLRGAFDYFVEHRSGILISRNSIPSFQGVDSDNIPLQNMGIVYNHGYELELSYNKQIKKDLLFSIKANYSYNRNEVKEYDEIKKEDTYVYQYQTEGFPLGQRWGYKIDWKNNGGYWISQDEIDKSGLSYDFGTPRVGDFIYIDQNGDDVINSKDKVPIKYSTIPGINYGLTLAANYKNFDFSVFFQGVARYSKTYSNQGVYENTKKGTYFGYTRHAWTYERYTNGEKITYPALSTGTTTSHQANDFFIMNRAFTRLKNIEFGYTLKESSYLKAMGISMLRIYVSGHNLYVWEHLRMNHLDPETDNSYGYPSTKNVNFGANITF